MPLTRLQQDVLALIASLRSPDSFVAGGAPANRSQGRYSEDIDIFHDREANVASAAQADAAAIAAAGFQVLWDRQLPSIHTAIIKSAGDSMRLDWVHDSDFRFYPATPDAEFGYVLQPIDLATNKAHAAAGRREPRDAVDLVQIDQDVLPLSVVIWAAVGKDPGYSPESLLNAIGRNARYRNEDLASLNIEPRPDARTLSSRLKSALERAAVFAAAMPTRFAGLLFLEEGRIVEPDPQRLDNYELRGCARAGVWPSDPEAVAELLRR